MTASVAARDRDLEKALAETAHAVFGRARPGQGPTGPDGPEVNAELVRELGETGFAGLSIAEELNGSGGTARHAGLVAHAAGYHAAAVPYLSQVLSAHAAAAIGDRELTRQLVDGALRGAVFFDAGQGRPVPSPSSAADVEVFFVRANRFPLRVTSTAHGLERDDVTWLAPDWHDVQLRLEAAAAHHGSPDWPDGLALSQGLAAAAMLGLVDGLLASSVEYVKNRRQFGAPVGSFQAIKHSLADIYIDLVHSQALACGALDALDSGHQDAARLLALAKIAADGTAAGARRCLQAVGGIGFTWESAVHRYLKQALRLRQWPLPHAQLRESVRRSGRAAEAYMSRPPVTSRTAPVM